MIANPGLSRYPNCCHGCLIYRMMNSLNALLYSAHVSYISSHSHWLIREFIWQLMDMSKYMGLSPCITLQQQYNLLNRELELELTDVCLQENVSVLPWSPLKGTSSHSLSGHCTGRHCGWMFRALATGAKGPAFKQPVHRIFQKLSLFIQQ